MQLLTVDSYLKLTSKFNQDINIICQPLAKNFRIHHFAYNRIYVDGSRFRLTTHDDLTGWIYQQNCSILSTIQLFISSGMHFMRQYINKLPLTEVRKCEKIMFGTSSHFNIDTDNGVCELINKYEKFTEVFDFGSPADNPLPVEFYINNRDVLEYFILYFNDKARALISFADENRIAPPANHVLQPLLDQGMESSNIEDAKAAFYSEANIQKIAIEYNGKSILLKKRELECLIYLMRGYTAKQTGHALNISPRTVECYLLSTKQKLQCYKKSDLISKLINNDVIKKLYFAELI